MKNKLLVFLLTLFFCQNAFSGKIGVDLGSGVKSNYGVLGLGFRYFPIKHFDIYYNVGVDIIGPISVLGLRIYTPPLGNRCLFIFPCKPLYYGGLYTGRSGGGTITTEKNGQESEYDFDNGKFGGVNIGFLNVFGERFYYSFDIGYRSYIEAPDFKLEAGPRNKDSEDEFSDYIKSGMSFTFYLGFMF